MRAFDLLEGRAHLYLDNNGLRIGTWYPAALGYALFGINNVGLVIYPLVMSVLAIVVMAKLGTRLFDRRTGLFAALLLAFYPLDVELSTRLLPDALLAAWSLVAIYFLLTADLLQEEGPAATTLRRPWLYSSAARRSAGAPPSTCRRSSCWVSWDLYALISALREWRRAPSFDQRFITVCCRRYVILLIGFLAVVVPEATLYRLEFSSFLAKYAGTLAHYNSEGRPFVTDLWMYPENMFFLRRGWTYSFAASGIPTLRLLFHRRIAQHDLRAADWRPTLLDGRALGTLDVRILAMGHDEPQLVEPIAPPGPASRARDTADDSRHRVRTCSVDADAFRCNHVGGGSGVSLPDLDLDHPETPCRDPRQFVADGPDPVRAEHVSADPSVHGHPDQRPPAVSRSICGAGSCGPKI